MLGEIAVRLLLLLFILSKEEDVTVMLLFVLSEVEGVPVVLLLVLSEEEDDTDLEVSPFVVRFFSITENKSMRLSRPSKYPSSCVPSDQGLWWVMCTFSGSGMVLAKSIILTKAEVSL